MIKPSIIEAKFLRSKTKSIYTLLWGKMNNPAKKFILSQVQLLLNERPIICFSPNNSYWWLLTDKRFMFYEKNHINYYSLNEFERVELKDLFEDRTNKQECSSMIFYISKDLININLEKGTWPIIYDIFKFVMTTAQKNKI